LYLENRIYCCKNYSENNVLLIDDMVDSRWTFTVCGYKLRKYGSGKVFPFALANSANRGDE
jgi:ATP-dependent DNA helicase RecQ